MIPGCDLSYAQGGGVNYHALSGKVSFLYHRASYGDNPDDDDDTVGTCFTQAHDACKVLHIPFGAYMFWLAGADPAAQAQRFLAAANGKFGQLAVMVDVEEGSFSGPSDVQSNINRLATTLSVLQAKVGQPIIYTNADTWNTRFGGTDAFSGHRLWVASYGVPEGEPVLPTGWNAWAAHQYTSGGQLPGVPGFVDLDVAHSLAILMR